LKPEAGSPRPGTELAKANRVGPAKGPACNSGDGETNEKATRYETDNEVYEFDGRRDCGGVAGWLCIKPQCGGPGTGRASPDRSAQQSKEGSLQVYSARVSADVDVNAEEFFWNNDFGRNDFLYEPAHADYTIYGSDGKVLKRVRNAHDWNDGKPALVKLPPGHYEVQAQAEAYAGETIPVKVPVVIKAGHETVVHLGGDWKPRGHYKRTELVRLPNGQMAGWRATEQAYAVHPIK
jgi:hypothetical protein